MCAFCIAWADYGSGIALDSGLPLHELRVALGQSPGYGSSPLFTESQVDTSSRKESRSSGTRWSFLIYPPSLQANPESQMLPSSASS